MTFKKGIRNEEARAENFIEPVKDSFLKKNDNGRCSAFNEARPFAAAFMYKGDDDSPEAPPAISVRNY